MNNTDIRDTTTDLKDDKVPGLSLRVFPRRKSFYLYYRTQDGIQRRPKLGDYPSISIQNAREIAQVMLLEVAKGNDPADKRRLDRMNPTVRELARRYMDRHGSRKKTAGEDQRQIDRLIVPAIGGVKVSAVRQSDVERLHEDYRETPIQANRALALLSKVFNLAERWEYRPLGSNPCTHVPRYPERKRRRYMTPDEAAKVFDRLRFHGNRCRGSAAFLWLLIYTGARPSEIAAARPEDVRGDTIVLQAHKTEHTGDARVIHLPPQAVALVAALPKTRSGTLTGVKSPRRLWDLIVRETGIENLHMYDLRHSFASIGISHGLTLDEVRELLGHKSTAMTTRYAHLIDEQARAAAAKTAAAFDEFAKPKLRALP